MKKTYVTVTLQFDEIGYDVITASGGWGGDANKDIEDTYGAATYGVTIS